MTDAIKSELKQKFKEQGSVCAQILRTCILLSNKIRFRSICALRHGELSVSEIIDIIGCGKQSNVSLQLKMLTVSGILTKRRVQKQWIYRLTDTRVSGIVAYLEKTFMKEGK